MKFLLLLLVCLPWAQANVLTDDEITNQCDSAFGLPAELQAVKTVSENLLSFGKENFYLYYEANELQDLQSLKNCLDYSMCGSYKESIVDDPANYRLHIWKKFSIQQLHDLVRSCPIKNLAKKLVVKRGGQNGELVQIQHLQPDYYSTLAYQQRSSPASLGDSPASQQATVNKITELLKANKVAEASKLVLSAWNIDIHGYKILYSEKPGSFAITQHDSKTITFGQAFTKMPCDFIRMLRHEAEHAAQWARNRQCKDHNFNDHAKRERAAHLNDVTFVKGVCGESEYSKRVQNTCLNRFRSRYMKTAK